MWQVLVFLGIGLMDICLAMAVIDKSYLEASLITLTNIVALFMWHSLL